MFIGVIQLIGFSSAATSAEASAVTIMDKLKSIFKSLHGNQNQIFKRTQAPENSAKGLMLYCLKCSYFKGSGFGGLQQKVKKYFNFVII